MERTSLTPYEVTDAIEAFIKANPGWLECRRSKQSFVVPLTVETPDIHGDPTMRCVLDGTIKVTLRKGYRTCASTTNTMKRRASKRKAVFHVKTRNSPPENKGK